jgi:hypothetical protein
MNSKTTDPNLRKSAVKYPYYYGIRNSDYFSDWVYVTDLRKYFPEYMSNQGIEAYLNSLLVLYPANHHKTQCSFDAFIVYFDTREQGRTFIDELNCLITARKTGKWEYPNENK